MLNTMRAILLRRRRRPPNICLTCVAVPVGLGIKLAERSDSKFYAKGNVRSKQLFYDLNSQTKCNDIVQKRENCDSLCEVRFRPRKRTKQ